MEKMKVKQFEFSQNWLFCWDKFNRSDAFMTAMIQESDKDVGDRTVSFMLNDPISDGVQCLFSRTRCPYIILFLVHRR